MRAALARSRASPVGSGWMLLLLLGLVGGSKCFSQQPAAQSYSTASSPDEQGHCKEDFGGVETFKKAQRDGLAQGVRWALIGVWIPIVVAIIVAIILLYTPRDIPSAKPFNKQRERKKKSDLPPPTSEPFRFW